MYKNVAGQKLPIYAYDDAAGGPKTGDAANITAQISINAGASAATDDAHPTELDATNHPGVYLFDLTQAEINGDLIIITAVSSTSNVTIEPIFAEPVSASIADVKTQTDGLPDMATELHLAHQAVIGPRDHVVATGVDQVYDSDGETVLKVLTPTEVDGTVTLTPSDPA